MWVSCIRCIGGYLQSGELGCLKRVESCFFSISKVKLIEGSFLFSLSTRVGRLVLLGNMMSASSMYL